MDTGIATGRVGEASPRFQARMAGVFAWIGTTVSSAVLVLLWFGVAGVLVIGKTDLMMYSGRPL